MELRGPSPLKKRKVPPSRWDWSHRFAIILDIAVFPVPTAPYIQHIPRLLLSSIHSKISAITSSRVPSKQPESPRKLLYEASGTGFSSVKIPSIKNYGQNQFKAAQ